MTTCEGDLSRLKVYEESLSYVERKLFDFTQSSYTALRVLDTQKLLTLNGMKDRKVCADKKL